MESDREQQAQEYERHLLEQIRMLQNEYQKAMQPYVKELGRLRQMNPEPIYVTQQEAAEIGRWKLG